MKCKVNLENVEKYQRYNYLNPKETNILTELI